ncbi:HupE/UreJ family protein [Nostoc sp. CENA67]|uniref:HupE/UreJ family protein n=1 Tax=Amazonocrinis nigriterrae CENA67 TaxID=2794033 RepID=A0A8J7L8P7_9NOST|nr:HupE/UreJ family protein [Amazonocrinis nigriterrae]MBH8562261.1 HupE/UreJ family protein [Amazonocrinis nigriterrae CENA67]
MFKIELSAYSPIGDFSKSKLQFRHLGAIASLVFISLLYSWSGLPSHHAIPNCWEGFLWGIANPVIALDRLASIVAIGLLSAGIVRGTWVAASFVLATVLGMVIYLFWLNLPGAEIAITISSMIFGTMLMLTNRPNWLILALLGAIAGLFQGYSDGQSIVGAGIVPSFAYILGVTVTQYAVAMSAREIGNTISHKKINGILPRTILFVGFALCAMGIVFLKSSLN